MLNSARLSDRLPGRRIEWFSTIDSTMTLAAELSRAGCADGTIVVADEQTAGVGRQGAKWHSQAGGLYVSIVLRLQATVPAIMLALGLATREAIIQTTPLIADLRWPNDVLIRGRKCAGVIAQVEGDAIIAGIGVNVSQREFPDYLETPATSLALEGARVSREDVLVSLVTNVDFFCALPGEQIREQFSKASSYTSGKRVRVGDVEGVTCGLNPAGFLVVREDNGIERTILAGGVRLI